MECILFYLVSIASPKISTVLQIKQDSVLYYDGSKYITERILHGDSGKLFLTSDSFIYVATNYKVVIGKLGKHHPQKYKVKHVKNCE